MTLLFLILTLLCAVPFVFMLPIQTSKHDAGTRYASPFLGNIDHRLSERLDVSSLSDQFVDENGYLIPGVVLRLDEQELKPISAGGQEARGVVLEAVKVAEGNTSALLNEATDYDVVVVTIATVDRAIAEFNMGRAYTANELSAIEESKKIVLTDPDS